jgi:pimeloyl-ACP methyl ester carboxylesterase
MTLAPIHSPNHWLSELPADYGGPRIALIHGFLAGKHMQRHLLRWVREQGYADTSLFSNHANIRSIADWLQEAALKGRPIALIGFSQGGFQVMKVAQELTQRELTVQLVVSIARGGAGWLLPAQWRFRHQLSDTHIEHVLNIYSHADRLGTNPVASGNALPDKPGALIENIALPRSLAIDHITLVRCYPHNRVHPVVMEKVLSPIASALARLKDIS